MKIKFNDVICMGNKTYVAGDVAEFTDITAQQLIDKKYAELAVDSEVSEDDSEVSDDDSEAKVADEKAATDNPEKEAAESEAKVKTAKKTTTKAE